MPQGTIKDFDRVTGTGILVLDDGTELRFDAETFRASGLVELRLGQRVRFTVAGEGDEAQVHNLAIVSL